jgi:glycosyltransferase involved in cell wall biosynthesis
MSIQEMFQKLPSRLLTDGAIELADYVQLPETPIVSVVMITYNHEFYIPEAIEGVVRQKTSFPVELIIAEDCSSDATRMVIRKYAERYPELIRLIVSEKNVGAHANLLRAESLVRGKYIAYCEGDDYWHNPSKLQKQVVFLEGHEDHILVHSGCNIRDGLEIVRAKKEEQKRRILQGAVYEKMLCGNYIVTCTVMVRASAMADFARSPLAVKPYVMGDFPRWVYVSRLGKLGYIYEPLSTYRLSPNSAMRSGWASTLRLYLSSREMQRDAIACYGCCLAAKKWIEKDTNSELLWLAMMAGNRGVFWREMISMLRINQSWLLNRRNCAWAVLFACHAIDQARPIVKFARSMFCGFKNRSVDKQC